MPRLRRFAEGEESAIFDIIKNVLADYGLKTNPEVTDADLKDIEANYFEKGGWFSVIESEENEIIGSYGLFNMGDSTCELRKMYLLPEYQGYGLGKTMMSDAIIRARKFGFEKMVLETNSKLTKATKLYEKYGFSKYEPAHLSDRCDFAMELDL